MDVDCVMSLFDFVLLGNSPDHEVFPIDSPPSTSV